MIDHGALHNAPCRRSSPRTDFMTAPLPPTLLFPQSTPPAPGAVTAVAPGIRWLRMPLPFALDHINLWLLADEIAGVEGWTAVDTGYGNDTTRELWIQHLADNLDGRPLLRVITTHYHPDHMGNAAWLLDRSAAPERLLWSTQSEFHTAHLVWNQLIQYRMADNAGFFARHGMPQDASGAHAERGNQYRRGVPELPQTYRRYNGGDVLRIGGRDWRVLIGLGHSPEHASLHCPELGVLISGDMLLPKISTNVSVWASDPLGDPVRLFLESIRRLTDLPDDTLVLPSHGLPFIGIRARVSALAEHHRARLAELEAAATTPVSAFDIVPLLFRRQLDIQQQFFAMGEAVAHLNHAWHQRRLQRMIGSDDVIRFSRIPA
jgi:glyoxylase-like metal-dependent hydrolase (beta-lactamase superfamily II)